MMAKIVHQFRDEQDSGIVNEAKKKTQTKGFIRVSVFDLDTPQ